MVEDYWRATDNTPMRWGTYSRISEDPRDLQRGVTRQRQDTRAQVEKRGGEVAEGHDYVENDTSAYRKKRVKRVDDFGNTYFAWRTIRPVWQQALADLRAGKIDGLMVYDLDRLARDPRDLEDAIEVVEHYGRTIDGESKIDLTTDAGRAMARVLVAMNNKSSADTGRRVTRAALDAAERGTAAGKRAFGWAEDKVSLDPVESALVREAVKQLVAGATNAGQIAKSWNEQGALTAHFKKPWTSGTVRQYLKNPRLAGYRTYRREIFRDKDGNPIMGQWEPLLTIPEWDELQGTISVPRELYRKPRRDARHYLLTGMLTCTICWGPMYGNRDKARKGRAETFYYRCTNVRHGENKHTLSISGPDTDLMVTTLVREKLAEMEPVEVTRGGAFPAAAQVLRLEKKIREVMTAYNNDQLPGSQAFPQVKLLEEELAPLRAMERTWKAEAQTPQLGHLSQMFNSPDVNVRRKVLETLLETVAVRTVRTRESKGFDAGRLDPWWKPEGETAPLAEKR